MATGSAEPEPEPEPLLLPLKELRGERGERGGTGNTAAPAAGAAADATDCATRCVSLDCGSASISSKPIRDKAGTGEVLSEARASSWELEGSCVRHSLVKIVACRVCMSTKSFCFCVTVSLLHNLDTTPGIIMLNTICKIKKINK